MRQTEAAVVVGEKETRGEGGRWEGTWNPHFLHMEPIQLKSWEISSYTLLLHKPSTVDSETSSYTVHGHLVVSMRSSL